MLTVVPFLAQGGNHNVDTRSIGEASIKARLFLGDPPLNTLGNAVDGCHEVIFGVELEVGAVKLSRFLNKNSFGAVDEDFTYLLVQKKWVNRP